MPSAAAFVRESLAPLVDLVYPPRCPVCGEGIAQQDGLCPACWGELVIPGAPACALCQRPFGSEAAVEGAVCAPCLARPPRHDGIAAGTIYNHVARQLVLAFKHGRRIALAPMLARLVVARLPEREGAWVVVPVPLHRWRLWQRGFNQAALIAREVALQTGSRLEVEALRRRKRTPMLGGLGRKARTRALSGAIEADRRQAAALRGANVILVDDVLTSGATSDACVAALKRAGAARVVVACFSRVLAEGAGGPIVSRTPDNETPGAEAPGAT